MEQQSDPDRTEHVPVADDAGPGSLATYRRWARGEPSVRFVWRTVLAVLAVDIAIWAAVAVAIGRPFELILTNYDAGWYGHIAKNGYGGDGFAFYPLWPLVVRGASSLVPLALPVVQALLATLLYLVVVWRFFTRSRYAGLFAPETRFGFLWFATAPASYVFHSGHTESLFLLLSLAAFAAADAGAWLLAAALAGLCALTRNQGVFVCVAVALWNAGRVSGGARLFRFALSGAIGAALFALYPLYQVVSTGDPLRFLKAQEKWAHAETWLDVAKTLILGNARTPWEYATRVHHPWFLGFLAASIYYWRERRQLALTVYFLFSVSIVLAQGNVSNFFRFSVVLAPLYFFIGDGAARGRVIFQALLVLANLVWHTELTFNYAMRRWAY